MQIHLKFDTVLNRDWGVDWPSDTTDDCMFSVFSEWSHDATKRLRPDGHFVSTHLEKISWMGGGMPMQGAALPDGNQSCKFLETPLCLE